MFRILVSDKLGQAGIDRLESAEDVSYDVKLKLSQEELVAAIGHYDGLIVRSGTKVTAEVLAAGKRLKVVGRAGIGVDNIDIRAATKQGIVVMNTPQANSIATAEQAIALMLAVSRHIAPAHASLLEGEWRRSDFVGDQLYRKVLGIIGFGRIGRLVATRAKAFGMEVLAFDPFVSEEIAQELGVTLVDLEDLLSQSDYITLHTVLTAQTENILGADTLSKVKPGAIVINSARGKLVDDEAILAGLKSGRLRAAAVDVYREEPPIGNPLIGHPNVLHTPHLGASTYEAQRDVATQIVDQLLDALRGEDYRNAINMPFHAGPGFKSISPYLELAYSIGVLHVALADEFISRVELEVCGERDDELIRPTAVALLKGIMERSVAEPINYISAPLLAEEAGITIAQTKGLSSADYPNLISARVHWKGGQRLISGVLFGGKQPRIVQIDEYRLDASPTGIILAMRNQDIPGVIGKVGTALAKHVINVGEWRMGRLEPGGEALSFISLDNRPGQDVLEEIARMPAVTWVKLVEL